MKMIIPAFLLLLQPLAAHAELTKAQWGQIEWARKKKFGAFLGMDPERLVIECGKSVELEERGGEKILKVCVNKRKNKQMRCEIAFQTLKNDPSSLRVSYDFRLLDDTPRQEWNSIMQIHSFADKGESWRCPPASLEVQDGKLRMYSRWDDHAKSKTSGYNCTESGSTIQGVELVKPEPIAANQWHSLTLDGVLSTSDKGRMSVTLDGAQVGERSGPNMYNDVKAPFIKLGIYKPTSWEPGHETSCVEYRNIAIESAAVKTSNASASTPK